MDKLKTSREVRRAFWDENPTIDRRRIRAYDGIGLMYPTDTRVAFVDWLDAAYRAGRISGALVASVALSVTGSED